MRESKLKRGQLTTKDMSTVREADRAKDQKERSYGELRDYSLQHKVEMRWDLNEDSIKDQIFELTIDGTTKVLLDAEQLQRYLRWV